MSRTFWKNTLREISNTKARFISILLIVALGVGFFVGIKCTNPSMIKMAEDYYQNNNLMDFRVLSTVGFNKDDVKEISNLDGVSSVMPSYFTDVKIASDGSGNIIRLMGVSYSYEGNDEINKVNIRDGRLPQKKGEIAIESGFFTHNNELGSTISFEEKIGDVNTKDSINSLDYKVVGIVQSPMYISFERGTTSVGNGKITSFAFVSLDDFNTERFTELYVRLSTSKSISPFSDEYNQLIDEYTNKIEDVSNQRVKVFIEDNIDSAQKELDENKNKYNDEKEKVNKELNDAKNKIDIGESEYYSGISSAQSQISQGEAELQDAINKLNDGKAELEKNKKEFEEKFSKARKELDENWTKYNAAYSAFEKNQKAEALAAIDQLKSGIIQVASDTLYGIAASIPLEASEVYDSILYLAGSVSYENARSNLEFAQAILIEGGFGELAGIIDGSLSQVDSLQSTLDETKAALDDAENQFAIQKAQLDAAENEYSTNKEKYQKEIDNAQDQIAYYEGVVSSGRTELESGKATLEKSKIDGLAELNKAKKDYNEGKEKAEKELKEAKDKLDDAQEKLDAVKDPKWYVFNRDDNPGYSTFIDNCDRVDNVATVFPLFFLLVAMLVCLTTMTRLIEEKRTEIGTFKALGFSNFTITKKFLIYSSTAAILGCVLGCAIGIPILPRAIYACYKIMYDMLEIPIVISYKYLLLGILAAIVACVFVSAIVCVKSLREKPASLMRAKSPKAGKRILLERIKPLWDKLSFTSKVTQRNLFRYKSRLLMTTIGIAGCTALIVAGFGLYDAIADIVDIQYGEINKYNITIVSDGDKDKKFDDLTKTISDDDRIDESMLVMQKSISVASKTSKMSEDIYVVVPCNPGNISNLIDLRNRITQESLKIEEGKAIISEKLATKLGVKVGDVIYLDGDKEKTVEISGICECYLYGYVYMTPSTYRNVFGKDVEYNMLLAHAPNMTNELESKISSDYLSRDDVDAVSIMTTAISSFEDMISSMKMITVILVVCAGALAIVVLYNLTNINLAERKREIATIKVLGFKHGETSAFVYRENMILTIIGIVFGLALGVLLTRFIVVTVEIDKVMFGRNIYFMTFVYAAIGTIIFSILVNFIMYFRIKKINMVESLKSIE